MKTPVRGSDRRKRGGMHAVAFVFAAVVAAGVVASSPASAQLLPPLPPLPLPTSSTGLDLGVDLDQTVDDVTNLLTDVPDQLGSIVGETTTSLNPPTVAKPKPNPAPVPQNPGQLPITGSWSVEGPPGLQAPVRQLPTKVSGAAYRRSLSYGSAVSNGFRAAVGRAAALAGPLAAPIVLALMAVGLIAVAARGPGRLVKVEEERLSGGERRSYRL